MKKTLHSKHLESFHLPQSPSENKNPPETTETKDNQIFQGYLEDWIDTATEKIVERHHQTKNPVIINMAGPSASGKTKAITDLKKSLIERELKVKVISMDDFYFGISKMLTDEISKLPFIEPQDFAIIRQTIQQYTGKIEYDRKFTPENNRKIVAVLSQKLGIEQTLYLDILTKTIAEFPRKIDFDHPDAIDLQQIIQIVEKIKHNQPFNLPKYSMEYSEPDGYQKTEEKCDIYIVEGLFGLNRNVTGQSDFKFFIEPSDLSYLFMRRIDRDVFSKDKRTTYSALSATHMILEKVFPAARNHIYCDRSEADSIIKNDLTLKEAVGGRCDVQDKIRITADEISIIKLMLETKLQAKQVTTCEQNDFYFADPNKILDEEDYQQSILKARSEVIGNKTILRSLTYKGPRLFNRRRKIIRPSRTIINQHEFASPDCPYENISELQDSFAKAGFITKAVISKTRTYYHIDKYDLDIMIDIVRVPSALGSFIEFRCKNPSQTNLINRIREEIGIDTDRPSSGPYIDLSDDYINGCRQKS